MKCYIEAHAQVPKGICRTIVKTMAWSFILSWGAYPILWLLGPEGFQKISGYVNTICHTVCDMVAKEFW
jgi:bacteriorhodopsin